MKVSEVRVGHPESLLISSDPSSRGMGLFSMDSYHLIFLTDYHQSRPFTRAKLDTFLASRTDSVSLWTEGSEAYSPATLDEVPEQNFFYPKFWIVSDGRPVMGAASILTYRKLYSPKSFLDINSFFNALKKTCHWALFPWGGVSSYGALCFLAAEETTARDFSNTPPNELRPYESFGERVPQDVGMKSFRSIVSGLRVSSVVEDVVTCAVFDENEIYARGRCV